MNIASLSSLPLPSLPPSPPPPTYLVALPTGPPDPISWPCQPSHSYQSETDPEHLVVQFEVERRQVYFRKSDKLGPTAYTRNLGG